MNIGEFFVKVGVTGADAASKALGGVKNSMKGIADASLESKAAIVGVFYALERLTGHSAKAAVDLKIFSDFTGMSSEAFQKWEFALHRFGITSDEVRENFAKWKQAILDMKMHKGSFDAIPIINQILGGKLDIKKAHQDMDYLGQMAQQAYKKGDELQRARLTESLHVSQKFAQAMRDSTDISQIGNVGLSQGDLDKNLKIGRDWADIWYKIDKLGQHAVATFGAWPVQEVLSFVDALKKISIELDKMISKMPSLKGWMTAAGLVGLAMTGPVGLAAAGAAVVGMGVAEAGKGEKGLFGSGAFHDLMKPFSAFSEAPPVTQSITTNVTVHGATDPHSVAAHSAKAVHESHKKAAQGLRKEGH